MMCCVNNTAATSYTWVGGTGQWDDSSKWMPAGIPGPGDNVEISAGGPTLVAPVTIHNLTALNSGTIHGDFDVTVNGLLIYNGFTTGGLYSGNGRLTVNGSFVWLEGTIGSPAATDSIIVNGLLVLSDAGGFGEHYLRSKTIYCAGGIQWQGGFIGCSDGARWIIPPGATLTETCSTYAEIFNPFSGGGTFENQGQFSRQGSAYLGIGYSFDGLLSFINTGTFTSNGAAVYFPGPLANEASGNIKGIGSVHLENDFINHGSISPGLTVGVINLISSTVVENQILNIDISGSGGPGTGHDLVHVSGVFDIDSSVLQAQLLGGYSPPFGTSFEIISATDSVVGAFSTTSLPTNFMVVYGTNNVSLIKNAAPVCAITEPPYSGFIYYDPAVINIEVLATDINDAVTLVEFYLDGVKIGEDHTFPYTNSSLVNTPMGTYTLTAKATDSYGASTISSPVEIIVRCIRQDIDNNGTVNTLDFLLFLSAFGVPCTTCPADFNLDGSVNTVDFLSLLAVFGYSCN